MAMNDKEVKAQLDRMVAFIKKEAEEKAREIIQKADEESAIERQRLVQAEKLKIMKEYERKEKGVEVQRKIAYSNAVNANRLRILKAREDAIAKIFAAAQRRLVDVGKGPGYKELLRTLVLQAALKMKEPEVLVRVRDADRQLAQDLFASVEQEYKAKTQQALKLQLDKTVLPPAPVTFSEAESCCGGCVLLTNEGRIVCNNTLDARLSLAFEQRLPEIRITLFGRSATRKFTT